MVSGFWFLSGLAWYCKPIAGILTDAFPLFGTRRRHYLLLSSAVAGAIWIAISFLHHRYDLLMWSNIVLNCFIVMCSTVLGGFLVESGQRLRATGRLTSTRMFATYTALGRLAGEVRIAACGADIRRSHFNGVRSGLRVSPGETAIGS